MNPEDIVTVLERIGDMIKPGASAAWESAMRQVIIEGMFFLITGVLIMALGIFFTYCCIKLLRKSKESAREAYIGQMYSIDSSDSAYFVGGGALVAFVMGLAFVTEGTMRLLNPVWFTLEKLGGLL